MNFYILVIIGLCLIIGILLYIIIRCYRKLPKKKRANELNDDNYIYEETTKKENLIN